MKKNINKKKLRDEVLAFLGFILGIVWFILGATKTTPGIKNAFCEILTIAISGGTIGGIALALLCLFYFVEVRNTKYPRNKAR